MISIAGAVEITTPQMVVVITYTGITFSIATKVVVIITLIMGIVVTDMAMLTVTITAAITIIIGSTTTKVITMINNNTMVIVGIRLHPAEAITIITISNSTKEVLRHQVANILVECQYKGNRINK